MNKKSKINKKYEEIIPEILLSNIANDVNSICPEMYQILTQKHATSLVKHLQSNLDYFKSTLAYITKQSSKQIACYEHMEEEGLYFLQSNPFAVLDCVLLYIRTLINVVEAYDKLSQSDNSDIMLPMLDSCIEDTIADITRVMSYFIHVDIKDSRVANFYLLNQTVH